MRRLPRIDFTKMKFRWHNLPAEVADLLAAEGQFEALRCVKSTDSRAVFHFRNYFLKVDWSLRLRKQFRPSAYTEYNNAVALASNHVDTVKHLGWGRCGLYTVLVTEAWQPDAVDVLNYWYKNFVYKQQDPEPFLHSLAQWLNDLLQKPLHHGDFHLGNVLYSESANRFTLVDLHNVKVGAPLTTAEKLDLLQILGELRASVRPRVLVDLFWEAAGIEADLAGQTIRKKLTRDLQRTRHDWPRRRQQFLSGYPKFSEFVRYKNQVLLTRRNMLRQSFFSAAAAQRGEYRTLRLDFPAALEQMLFSFWLSLLQVPHFPVVALAPDGTLYLAKMPEDCQEPPDREWVNEFNEYLLCLNLNVQDYHCWRLCNGSQLMIADFSPMLVSSPHRERFQIHHVDPRKWRV